MQALLYYGCGGTTKRKHTMGFPYDIREILDLAPEPAVLAKSVQLLIDGEIEGRRYEQAQWGEESRSVLECGSACCVAGHTVLEIGLRPISRTIGIGGERVRYPLRIGGERVRYPYYTLERVTAPNGKISMTTDAVARAALGLSGHESRELFSVNASEAAVRMFISNIAEGRMMFDGVSTCLECQHLSMDCVCYQVNGDV